MKYGYYLTSQGWRPCIVARFVMIRGLRYVEVIAQGKHWYVRRNFVRF